MTRASQFALLTLTAIFAACGSGKPPAAEPPGPAPSSATAPPAPLPTATAPADPSKGEQKTLFVKEELADCEGEAPMKCLQVREKETDEWMFFYTPIEGFEHEAGHRYELLVEVKQRPNAPADASSLRYVLVKIVSKEKVAAGQ